MKLLLVEDDRETAAYLKRALAEAGHAVDHASDGRDGLLLAAGETYDVMVLDRMLPQLDGLAILRTIRASGVKTPVLLLTALGGIDDRVEGLEAGGDDYLVKPFAFAELLARVNALARRPPPQDVQTTLRVADLEIEPAAAHRYARRRAHRAAAAGVPAAGIPDASRRPGGHAHHAAGSGLGLPLRSQDQHRRDPHQPAARRRSTAARPRN